MHQKQIYLILQFLDTPPEHVNGMIGILVTGGGRVCLGGISFWKERSSFILDLNRGLPSVLHVACVLNSKEKQSLRGSLRAKRVTC